MFATLRRRFRRSNIPPIGEEQWRRVESTEPLRPLLAHLSADERGRLRELAVDFVARKEWSGAGGLAIEAGMQLAISLQACLPVLHLGLDWYADWVGIVVYPGDFLIPRQITDEAGVVHEFADEVLGEAWEGGPVILSWFANPQEVAGINVVLHEFAHKLDMTNGAVDGLPRLHGEMSRREWVTAFAAAYEDFCRRTDEAAGQDKPGDLDPYGAESPAEFFAVMSEAFFQSPLRLLRQYPAVYGQLRNFYRQDPAGPI